MLSSQWLGQDKRHSRLMRESPSRGIGGGPLSKRCNNFSTQLGHPDITIMLGRRDSLRSWSHKIFTCHGDVRNSTSNLLGSHVLFYVFLHKTKART